MSLVHIIGNGFDLNAGLKTNYSDFYKYYLALGQNRDLKSFVNAQITHQPPSVLQFKKTISGDLGTWANLEVALGKYCNNLSTSIEFDEIFEDLSEHLTVYLRSVEQNIPVISSSEQAITKFYNDLLHPEQHVRPPWMRVVSGNRRMEDISIMSFNYTSTIQRLIAPDSVNIMHVHGTLDDEIIIGVNHNEQIANSDFRTDLNVTEAVVKPASSVLANKTVVDDCKLAIENAKLVSIFGSSLGVTDQYWWDLIIDCVRKNDLKVFVFWRASEKDMNRSYKPNRISRDVKYMLSGNHKDREEIEMNIAVATNTAMFDVFNKKTSL